MDLAGKLSYGTLMDKHILVAAGTQTAAGVDLRDYIDNVLVVIQQISPVADGSTTLIVSLLDSADNSTFATFAGAPTPVTTTAASLTTHMSLDTRNCQRYVQAKAVVTGTTATFDLGIVAVGLKQVS